MLNKILCVDDDAITLMLCKKVIERVAFANEVLTAKNGEEAKEFHGKHQWFANCYRISPATRV